MRSITIRYEYDGAEDIWETLINTFVNALNADPAINMQFKYQVAIADDGKTRIHWGLWDSEETLKAMQSQDYFKTFATGLRDLIGGPPDALGADVFSRTGNW